MKRRTFLHLAASAAVLPAAPRLAWAQAYPTRPINLVVPFAAGGATDVTARIVAQHMSRTLGQQLPVENVFGAGGTIGTTRVARATPDGYTIMMGQLGTHALSVPLYPSLPYRPDIDFAPVGRAVDLAFVIIARKDFPPKNLSDFVSYVKMNANKLNAGHAGVGSITHGVCLLLDSILGISPVLVPFNGAGPALNALIGGQTDYMCSAISDVVQQVLSGSVKAYAIGSAERSAALPNVPTSREAGLPEFQAVGWFGLFAPREVPKPVLSRLTDALDRALDDPSVRKRLLELGCDIPDKAERGPLPLAVLVKDEIARWTPIIRAANVKLE